MGLFDAQGVSVYRDSFYQLYIIIVIKNVGNIIMVTKNFEECFVYGTLFPRPVQVPFHL